MLSAIADQPEERPKHKPRCSNSPIKLHPLRPSVIFLRGGAYLQIPQAEGWHKSQVVFGERFTDGQRGERIDCNAQRLAEAREVRVVGCFFRLPTTEGSRRIDCRTILCLFNVEVSRIELDVISRCGKRHIPFDGLGESCEPAVS